MSRDAFEVVPNGFSVVFYCQHTAIPSVMAPPVPLPVLLLEGDNSPFFKRNLERDFSKTLFAELRDIEFDILLCDLIEERCDLLASADSLVTSTDALRRSPVRDQVLRETAYLARSEMPPDAFRAKVTAYAANLAQIVGNRPLVLADVRLASIYEKNGRFQTYPAAYIDPINERLSVYREAFLEGAPQARVIETGSRGYRGDYGHRWGSEPFHFEVTFYQQIIDDLSRIAHPELPERVMSSYEWWWRNPSPSLSADFQRTYRQYVSGQYAACAAELLERAARRPLTADECHYFGRALYAESRAPLAAAQLLTFAVEHDASEPAWARAFLARAHMRIGNATLALVHLKTSLALDAGRTEELTGFIAATLEELSNTTDAARETSEGAAAALIELATRSMAN